MEKRELRLLEAAKEFEQNDIVLDRKNGITEVTASFMAGAKSEAAYEYHKMEQIQSLIKKVELAILETPTGKVRNLLCDINIRLQQISGFLKLENKDKIEALDINNKTKQL